MKKGILLLLIGLVFLSCEDDDTVTDDNDLLGTWRYIAGTTDGIDDNFEETSCAYLFTLIFTEDNVTTLEYHGSDCMTLDELVESYTFDGTTIILDDGGNEFHLLVLELTETTLTVQEQEDDFIHTTTYRRE